MTKNLDINISKDTLPRFLNLAQELGLKVEQWEGDYGNDMVVCTFTGRGHHLIAMAELSHQIKPFPFGFSEMDVLASMY